MIRLTIAGVLAALMLSVASSSAHDNYRIIGTVVKLAGTTLDITQTKNGKTISMEMTKTSRVTRNKKPVKASEIKAGASVVVDAQGDSLEELDVVEVKIVPAPTKK